MVHTRVTNEEDGGVVEHPVKVALIRPDLDGEPTGIAGGIRGAGLATDGGDTECGAGASADLLEERGAGDVGDIVGDFEVAVGTEALRVNLRRAMVDIDIDMRKRKTRRYEGVSGIRTTRSGIRSRSKWARRSIWWKSRTQTMVIRI